MTPVQDPDLDVLLHPTMTVQQAGRLLGVGRSTAYNAAKRGELPTFRLNGRLVVPTAEVRRMLRLDDTPPPK